MDEMHTIKKSIPVMWSIFSVLKAPCIFCKSLKILRFIGSFQIDVVKWNVDGVEHGILVPTTNAFSFFSG